MSPLCQIEMSLPKVMARIEGRWRHGGGGDERNGTGAGRGAWGGFRRAAVGGPYGNPDGGIAAAGVPPAATVPGGWRVSARLAAPRSARQSPAARERPGHDHDGGAGALRRLRADAGGGEACRLAWAERLA